MSPDFRYVEPWKNGRAVIEVGGVEYRVIHMSSGFYVASRGGVRVARPYRRLVGLVRALAKVKD